MNPERPLRVIIAEDDTLLRQGLASLLSDAGFEVTAEVADADSLLRRVKADPPDAALVDIRMPPTHTTEGLDAARQIRQDHPKTAVLLLSQHVEAHHAATLLEEDGPAIGYLLKQRVTDRTQLVDALHRVSAGEPVLDPLIVTRLFGRRRKPDPLAKLTEREREVLAHMAEGRSNQAISDQLHLSPKTVETHIRHILLKLNIHSEPDHHRRVLAVLTYLRQASA